MHLMIKATAMFLFLSAACAILAVLFLPGLLNGMPGFRSFLVQSGSMEPSIMTGDIIIVKPDSRYEKNDVITFINREGRTVTHRIAGTNGKGTAVSYVTKGDANRAEDEDTVSFQQVAGKVVLVVPKLGFLVGFAKTGYGMLAFIGLPALILAGGEFVNIIRKS